MLCNFALATLSQFAIQVDTAVLPALEREKTPSTATRSFYTSKSAVLFESKSHVRSASSLCIINQSHGLIKNKAIKIDHY